MKRVAVLTGVLLGLVALRGEAGIRPELLIDGFVAPVFATAPPGDENRLFVVEQGGTIRIVDLGQKKILPKPFLTIDGLATGGEQGLLGLAFDPDYARNRTFYVNITVGGDGNTVIRRYQTSAKDPNLAQAKGFVNVLGITQPYSNHNGGWIGFGPDGYLYIASGDGGSGNDPQNNAQNRNSLLGKILRIDVKRSSGGRAYAIPADNPFAAGGGEPEIWHYGLRNPWRCSFDRKTGDLWIGDVGQSAREEINVQLAGEGGGKNFGWRVFEGDIRTPEISDAVPGNAVAPVFSYSHAEGYSVTGGYVMRNRSDVDAQGVYVFGDFSGRIWTKRLVNGALVDAPPEAQLPRDFGAQASSFAEDAAGRLYVIDYGGGIYRLRGGPAVRPVLRVTGDGRRVETTGSVVIRGQVVATDPVRGVRYRVGNGEWTAATGRAAWRARIALPRGKHRIQFEAEDAEGRRSAPQVVTVTRR